MDVEAPRPTLVDAPRLNAPARTARLQAWVQRIGAHLSGRDPIAGKVILRSEFSGALTCEQSATALCRAPQVKGKIEVTAQSMADWSSASQTVAQQNHPTCCRFRNIMDLVPYPTRVWLEQDMICQAG